MLIIIEIIEIVIIIVIKLYNSKKSNSNKSRVQNGSPGCGSTHFYGPVHCLGYAARAFHTRIL